MSWAALLVEHREHFKFPIFPLAHAVIFAVQLVLPKIEDGIILYMQFYVSEFETVFDIVVQCESSCVFGIVLTNSSVYFEEVNRQSSKFIPIQLNDITLSAATYPRLRKTCHWLKTKHHCILGAKRFSEKTHVLLFRTKETSNDYNKCPFTPSEIENNEPLLYNSNWSNRNAGQLLVDKYSQKNVPFIILLLISVNEHGNIRKQDKHLLKQFQKELFPHYENDVLYVVKPDNADLKELSKDIQYKLKVKGDVNKVFCRTFEYTDDNGDLKKRIGLLLERKLHASIVYEVERLLQQTGREDMEVNDSPTMYNKHQSFSDPGTLNEIIDQFKQPFPDNCSMHELQVLMTRNKEVKAYGFDENKISVFVEQEEQKARVKAYLYKYFPECEENVNFKLWGNENKISKCNLKQGSEIFRSDSKHGTLGMFLRDQTGSIYFTTCSHVTEKDQHALCKDKKVIGKSVFSIDTATDTNVSDLLDLSIIKVEDALKLKCHLGLRDVHDNQVTGQIVEEDDIQQEIHKELKIYKWGATTNLTTGTYKGWIASKDCSDRFDKSLHRIVGETNNVFAEGDSGSLVCFKVTGSPHLDVDSAVFIFVGKLISSTECAPVSSSPAEWYYCYHVSKIFDQMIENVENFEPCLEHECRKRDGCMKSGKMLKS